MEVQEVIRGAKSSSAPGPSGVPYLTYKCCPELLWQLWKNIRMMLSVEDKIFFSVLSQCQTDFVLQNDYIITSVWGERGCHGVPSCLEHTSVCNNFSKKCMMEDEIWSFCSWTSPMPMSPYHTDWLKSHWTGTMFSVTSRTLSWITTVNSG